MFFLSLRDTILLHAPVSGCGVIKTPSCLSGAHKKPSLYPVWKVEASAWLFNDFRAAPTRVVIHLLKGPKLYAYCTGPEVAAIVLGRLSQKIMYSRNDISLQ